MVCWCIRNMDLGFGIELLVHMLYANLVWLAPWMQLHCLPPLPTFLLIRLHSDQGERVLNSY